MNMVITGWESMVKKLGVSVTNEVDHALDYLAQETSLAKSRLIDTLLREHPMVRQKLAQSRLLEVVVNCSSCGTSLTDKDIRISTPKYGTLCLTCWSSKAGEIVERHPISDNESRIDH
jgi:hypothetical protein